MAIPGQEDAEYSGRNRGRKGMQEDRTSEIIPMSEFRGEKSENLRKIHAQSSAETSGLGDSLQRIHTLSSTETSGYGDTVPSPTAPTPSPESGPGRPIPAGQDTGYAPAGEQSPKHGYGREHRSPVQQRAMGQEQEARRHSVLAGGSPRAGSRDKSKSAAYAGHNPKYTGAKGSQEFVCLAGGSKNKRPQHARQASPPPPDLTAKFKQNENATLHDCHPSSSAHHTEQTRPQTRSGGSRPRLQRSEDLDEGIDGEFGDMGTYYPSDTPPIQTRNKHKPDKHKNSDKSHKNHSEAEIHGVKQSTWLKWSQERRTSFKNRLDSLEQRQKEHEQTRMSTPRRKARKESVMFVSPDLEDTHLGSENEFPLPSTPYHMPHVDTEATDGTTVSTVNSNQVVVVAPRKTRRLEQDIKSDVKLSENQMNALSAFWEHDTFTRSRWAGILISLLGFIFGIAAVTTYDWSRVQYSDGYLAYSGLWKNCSSNISQTIQTIECSIQEMSNWQNAVIGLLVFSVASGFLATILSISGVCAAQLPRKIYYYHSAGEIYLICALSCVAGLIVYPSALATVDIENADLSYGVGYGLGWGAAFFFLTSAVCMCLDDLVRAFARGLCQCIGRRDDNDTRV